MQDTNHGGECPEEAPKYKIGAVATLTGLSTHTIRAWERRYQLDLPTRTQSGNRVYCDGAVNRLRLVKALIDQGETISSIAHLEEGELRQRLGRYGEMLQPADLTSPPPNLSGTFRLGVLEGSLTQGMQEVFTSGCCVSLVFSSADVEAVDQALSENKVDALLVTVDELSSEAVSMVEKWFQRSEKLLVVGLYHFVSTKVLTQLDQMGVKLYKGPFIGDVLKRIVHDCLALNSIYNRTTKSAEKVNGVCIPSRIFSNEQLAQLQSLSPSIACECPQHLSNLVNSLNAFEEYCRKCESQSEEDAELHAELGVVTARARALMEQALVKTCEHDRITL